MVEKKDVKRRKPPQMPEDSEVSSNDILQAVNALLLRQDELEDEVKKRAGESNGHRVYIAKEMLRADERRIVGLSRISNITPGPLSLCLAVGDYLKRDIQSGRTTLPRRRIDYFLNAQLSAHAGWNREKMFDALLEQLGAEASAETKLADELEAP